VVPESVTERLFDSENDIERAAAFLRNGRLVVFPTETVYGLGADARNEDACRAIFAAKERPPDNPLIVHYADADSLLNDLSRGGERDGSAGSVERARSVLAAFSPGPITLVVPRISTLSPTVSAGLPTVAVRIPAHRVARRLIASAGVPIAAPSANRSGRPSPTDFSSALHEMTGRVAAVIDGGECRVGLESTVLDITVSPARILRPGVITAADITARCGFPVTGDGGSYLNRSPGTRYRHYRPSIPVLLLGGGEYDLRDLVRRCAPGTLSSGSASALVAAAPTGDAARAAAGDAAHVMDRPPAPNRPPATDRPVVRLIGTTAWIGRQYRDAAGIEIEVRAFSGYRAYAAAFYRELFSAEQRGAICIAAEFPVDDAAAGPALIDRLRRAGEMV